MNTHMPRTKKSATKKAGMKKMTGRKGIKGGLQLMQKSVKKVTKPLKKRGWKGGVSIAIGSATGAIVGGLAGAALSDEKTRKNIGQSLTSFAKNAQHNIEALSNSSEDIKKSTRELSNTARNVQSRMKKK